MTENIGDSDSCYLEHIWRKEIFVKEYKKDYINKTILEIYHTLHHYMYTKKKEVYFGDISIDGRKIDIRSIEILDLDPQWIYETKNIETKETMLITNPTYVPWKTLNEYEDQLGKERTWAICEAITRYIEIISNIKFTDMYWVTPINVKVKIRGNIANLIVTDMSCSIKKFFYSWKNAVILDKLFNINN